ncbi:MAG: hypothetical protein K6E40_12170 [Desulfovibrio sp.]|nr:hypothetical protein [Desulfovibrio sp.]
MSGKGHWDAGDWRIRLPGGEELEAAMPMLRQSFDVAARQETALEDEEGAATSPVVGIVSVSDCVFMK